MEWMPYCVFQKNFRLQVFFITTHENSLDSCTVIEPIENYYKKYLFFLINYLLFFLNFFLWHENKMQVRLGRFQSSGEIILLLVIFSSIAGYMFFVR